MSRSTILFEVRKYFFSQLLWEGNSQNIPRLVQAIFSKSPLPLSANLNKLAILNFEVYSLFDWTPLLDRYQGQPAAPGINAQSTDGYTMLMVAIQEQDRETINTHLANPELNINLQAKCGLTALIAATKLNDVDTIRAILTTQGSKVNFALSTAQGQTALDIACMMCNPDIMALLARDLTLPNDDQAQAAPAHTAPLSQPHTTQPTGELASLAELDGYFQVPQETLYLPTLSPTRTIINQTSSITVDHSSSTQLGEPAAKRLKLSV